MYKTEDYINELKQIGATVLVNENPTQKEIERIHNRIKKPSAMTRFYSTFL